MIYIAAYLVASVIGSCVSLAILRGGSEGWE